MPNCLHLLADTVGQGDMMSDTYLFSAAGGKRLTVTPTG